MNTPEKFQDLCALASAGDASAQNDLGCAYHNGDGVQKDYATARLWYERAAAQGCAIANSNLAKLYEFGLGVAKDTIRAFSYQKKAADLGNTNCMNIVARAYRYGTDLVEIDLVEAFKWYKKAADLGDINAAESLAIFYDYGYGCEVNHNAAVKWYLAAAEKGLRVAQNNLGAKYENGQGVQRDFNQAFYWYKKSAEQGEPFAECNLGIFYLEGKGTVPSKKDAYIWFKRSADHNHERAKQRLQGLIDSGYDPDKDKVIFSVDVIARNPFRLLGTFVNASAKEIQANKTKINAFLNVDNTPDFTTDHLMMDEKCPALFDEDNEPIFVPRDEQSVNSALSAINMPLDRVKYALFWFANVTPIDDLALKHISDEVDINEATMLWMKKENFSSYLNRGVMYLCVGNIESAIENYTELLHVNEHRKEFLKAVVGENYSINEEELSHLFIDTIIESFPNENWRNAFQLKGKSADDNNYIVGKMISGSTKLIDAAIEEAKSVDNDSALLNYNASKKLKDTTISSLRELRQLMGVGSAQYQMLVDKLANQILQNAINYFNNSDEDNAPFKAMELQKYAQSIAVGKMAKDRCTQNMNILQGIIDKLPPKEIRQAVSKIHATLKRYSQMAKENSKANKSNNSLRSSHVSAFYNIIGTSGPYITRVAPMIESLVKDIVFIREKMGAKSKDYISIVTDVSAVALGITIENVNNSQIDSSPYRTVITSPKIRKSLEDAVKVVQYIQLMGPEQKFLSERLEPNKKTLDKMAASFAVFAHVDSRTFYTENEYYISSHTKSELQAFISKYPNGTFAQSARNKIAGIEALENQLANVTSIDACKDIYDSRQRDKVCDGLIDDKCFSLVKNKEKDCRKYLEAFSNHQTEVKAKLKTIHKWWWALGIVNASLLGCLLLPEMIALPIIVGAIALLIDVFV